MRSRYISLGVLLTALVCMHAGFGEMRRHPAHTQAQTDYPVDRTTIVPPDVSPGEVLQMICPYIGSGRPEKTIMVVTRDHSRPPALYVLFPGKTRYGKFVFPGLEIVIQERGQATYEIAQK